MKKLKFEEGAITPFWLKDLEYMQEGIEEVFEGIVRGLSLGKSNFLISGCKISLNKSNISMTSGWFYYAGEILPVKALPETPYTGSNPRIEFTKITEYDSSGVRLAQKEAGTMESNVYEMDYLVPYLVSSAELGSNKFSIGIGAWDLGTRIANKNRLMDTGLVTIEVDETISPVTGYIQYRQIGGVVQLYGHITNSGFITDRLPVPATKMIVNIGNGSLILSADGLSAQQLTESIRLDGITYLSDPIYESVSDGHYSTAGDSYGSDFDGSIFG